jgi:hypothetical protein
MDEAVAGIGAKPCHGARGFHPVAPRNALARGLSKTTAAGASMVALTGGQHPALSAPAQGNSGLNNGANS